MCILDEGPAGRGADGRGPRALSIEARSTSPATTPGRLGQADGVDRFAVVRAERDRSAGRCPVPAGTSVTVQLNVSVASTVAPSRTVMLTAYGLALRAGRADGAGIRPVAVLIERPGGRFAGGVRQRIAVGVGGARVEVDQGALGAGPAGQVLVEGGLVVGRGHVGHGPAERVGRIDRGPVAHGDADRVRAGAPSRSRRWCP